jgi:hypothetical protein
MSIRNTLPLAEPTSHLCQSWMENINNGISTSMYNGGGCTRDGHGSILGSTDGCFLRRCTLDLPIVPPPGAELSLGKRCLLTIFKRLLPHMVRAKLCCEES